MIKLRNVFSDNALFQADSEITLHGAAAENSSVCVCITGSEGVFCSACADADEKGEFAVTLKTPSASFDSREISVTCGAESAVLHNVLFGELWLASGQSNMELANASHPEFDTLQASMKDKLIRVYHCEYFPADESAAFPWDPVYDIGGRWILPSDRDGLAGVSACAFRFAVSVYDELNRESNIPVGILNNSWGGTSMPSWFPRDEMEKDEYIVSVLKRCGAYPVKEEWNSRGICNYQQTCAQYNVKIACIEGLKVRGVIWYQGENETGGQYWNRCYADYLRFYHRVYSKRFGADPDHFMMISSLIYPWIYGASGECSLGYINRAFIETALEAPDRFAFMPISDLPPRWAYHQGNHPIHPTNKYAVGERLARLALTNSYGFDGQKRPATLESFEIIGNRVCLKFLNDGYDIVVNDVNGVLRGMYVAGEDNVYLPADYEIISGDTMEVWCDEIVKPEKVAYNIQSLEPGVDLFAGEFPVASFYSDNDNYIGIEARRWYDMTCDAVWGNRIHGEVLDLFYRPVWTPAEGTEVTRDFAFCCESICSLRAEGEGRTASVTVKSYPYNRLDFEKFSGMKLNLFNTSHLAGAKLILRGENSTVTECAFEKTADLTGSWSAWKTSFTLPEGEISSMTFEFDFDCDEFRFVNMEKVRLLK